MKRLFSWLLLLAAPLLLADGGMGPGPGVVSYSGGGAATPILFQHIASSTNPIGFGLTGHAFIIHTESIPANAVAVMFVTVPAAASTFTISDTLAGSWAAASCTATGGTGNYKLGVFVQSLGATGGTDAITINIGTTSRQPVQYDLYIWLNAGAVDGCTNTASGGVNASGGGVITPPSLTPTTNNNANGGHIILADFAIASAAGSNASNWTATSGFSLAAGEIVWTNDQGFPDATQYEVQTTNAAVVASITATGENATGDTFNAVVVAVKVANNSATTPSTIHVVNIIHESTAGYTSPGSGLKVMLPTLGNLRVATFSWAALQPGGGPATLSSLTSSDGCTWAIRNDNSGAGVAYAQNCSPCATCTLTLNWTGTQTLSQFSFRLYDIQNAAASSFQNSAGNQYACGTTLNNAPSITPTGATSGLSMAVLQNGNGPVTAITSPSGAVFDLWLFTGQSDGDMADNADFSGHYYYSSLAAQNYDYTKTNGSDNCAGEVGTFN